MVTRSFVLRSASRLFASSILVAASVAQTFDYAFDAAASSITIDTNVALDLTGSLKGVFDAVSNPGGTRTVLGVFGDNGLNNEVPVTITLGVDALIGGAVVGTFELDYEPVLGAATVSGLFATIGAGGSSSADLTVTLTYDTFRSLNPNSVYIGGFPLTLPLGAAAVTDVVLTQIGPGAGTAVPGAAAGSIDLDAAVTAELSFNVDLSALGGTGITPVGPLPIVLPLTGAFDLADCGTVFSATSSSVQSQSLPNPFPFDLVDQALPLPTILPPGGTADLLLNASLDALRLDGTVTASLVASAGSSGRTVPVCDGNVNSSGLGGALGVAGSTSVTAQDLALVATNLPSNSLGYMLMSRTEALVPGFGGSQGTLCLGGTLYRFSASVQQSGPMGEVTFAPDFGALPSGQTFAAADSWSFQYWFRDANPGPTSNTTGAVRVLFCR
ncbi:hypothetical protein Poly30_31350 [Planctomycetes bacterium Poly30]|uniref:Uncharacterized protein n=1 Tax=Saltatorellus ferox TaxID=2528018 RepID=A0A518EU82_9BACT|nr:hypothetical protein Poly30_31350 [Planctomycetes bacterium Poly30]